MADSAYELVYRLAQLGVLERECDGDIDKVILWWEIAHHHAQFARLFETNWAAREVQKTRREIRRAQVKLLVQKIALKRLAEKVVP